MQQQQTNQEVEQVQSQLQASQSRSFEMISSITAERDQARQEVIQIKSLLGQIGQMVGLDAEFDVEALMAGITKLLPKPKVKK